MAFCRKCGNQIDDEAVICPKCGVAQQALRTTDEVSGSSRQSSAIAGLGIFLPIIGWPYYASMADKASKQAKDLLIGNIIGTIMWILIGLGIAALAAVY